MARRTIVANEFVYLLILIIIFPAIAVGISTFQESISNASSVKSELPLMLLDEPPVIFFNKPPLLFTDNSKLSSPLSSLNWGTLYPGSSKEQTFWIYNNHTINSMKLNCTTRDWLPKEASNYMVVTWDSEKAILAPESFIKVTLQLTVFKNITGITIFRFNNTITGTQV